MKSMVSFSIIAWFAYLAIMPVWAQVPMEYDAESRNLIFGGSWYVHYVRNEENKNDRDVGHNIYSITLNDEEDLADLSALVKNPDVDVNNRVHLIFNSKSRIVEFKLAPKHGHVALREGVFEEDVSGNRVNYTVSRVERNQKTVHHYYENARLQILNLDGEALSDPIDSVRRYVWSPDGNKVAYITGDHYEGGSGFLSTGTWILDMGSRENDPVKIYMEGSDLNWRDNNKLYIWDVGDQVLRYDTNQKTIEDTSRNGIYFSPDGHYYFDPAREGEPIRLFTTYDDQEVTQHYSFLTSEEIRHAQPRGWLDDRTLLIPSPRYPDFSEFIYFLGKESDEKKAESVAGLVIGKLDHERLLVLGPENRLIERSLHCLRTSEDCR